MEGISVLGSNREEIYLDHNATAPARREVLEAMLPWLGIPANPSSTHEVGRRARQAVSLARAATADLLGCEPSEITFVSGATEANNISLRSFADRQLFISAVEHPSVLRTSSDLAERGTSAIYLPVTGDGRVAPETLREHLANGSRRALVSMMLANNETGVINDVASLTALVRDVRPDAVIHCDASQAVGRVAVDLQELDVDLLSVSGHKFGGPQGIGVLVSRSTCANAIRGQTGGEQERGRRAGSLNVAGIVGLGAAAASLAGSLADEAARVRRIRDQFEHELKSLSPSVQILGADAPRLPNTSLVAVPEAPAEAVMAGVPQLAISHGSACSAGAPGPSHVLRAMRVPDAIADCALRVSFGPSNTPADASSAAQAIAWAAERIAGQLATAGGRQ